MSKQRRQYTEEFKREAVELAATSGKPVKQLERELGLGDGCLRLWIRQTQQAGEQAFPGHGRLSAEAAEQRALVRENQELRQQVEILKKAMAIFTQAPRRSSPS